MIDHSPAFNLTEVWEVIKRQWKLIASFVGIVLFITLLLLFFVLPKIYKSTGVIIAANPALADKSRILNSNVQHLYSPYGSGDDLNRLEAIAKLDTIYLQLVKGLKLVNYYELSGKDSITIAVEELKEDLIILKTERDELHIISYSQSKELGASLVNKMISHISAIAELSWRNEYTSAFGALQNQIEQTENQLDIIGDSLKFSSAITANVAMLSKRAALVEQLQSFYKAANEYQLAFNNNPSALVVLQNGVPALKHVRPKKAETLLLAFIASLAFAVIAALVYDRRIIS